MPFETLSPRLQIVATKSLAHCKAKYGGNGVKIEEGIDDAIKWRPTFFLKPSKSRIIAVEVEDNLYPNSLKWAAQDVGHFEFPISIYQACTLDAFLNDPKQTHVNNLKKHGFGIITVDDDGKVTVQHSCVPLAQHISPDLFDSEIKKLTQTIKVSFRAAYDVYTTNEGQGLQAAGQIVEGIVASIADTALKRNDITGIGPRDALATRIDKLYDKFPAHRAALGGAREFVQEFRNTASHPAKSAKEAAEKIRKCRKGFLDAIALAVKLRGVAQALGYPIKVFVT